MKPGCVHLIGAGPGEPALISVRGLQRLRSADVIVYDAPLGARQLRALGGGAELVDAAQAGGQDAVADLLANRAAAGSTVARLIHGDPLLHAPGEAQALRARGAAFEIVPGIPSAIADPGFAGIPLGAAETEMVVLLPGGPDRRPEVANVAGLCSSSVTVVAHGPAATLRAAADALLDHARAPSDPAALIVDGALPGHRTIDATLGAIGPAITRTLADAAGVLVVGPAADPRQRLRWFDNRPLSGRRVVVTRAREQAADLVDRLLDLGAEPVEAPVIHIAPPDDYRPLDAACAAAASFDWIVFTSVNGVDAFLERLLRGPGDLRALGGARLCAIGPATAGRLRRHGLKADVMPAEHRAEAVFDALRQAGTLAGARVLLARADIARPMLADALRSAGAEVTDATAYRTVRAEGWSRTRLDGLLRAQPPDVVTFTSASTVRNFVEILGSERSRALLVAPRVACIGPVTAGAARELGIETAIMPATYTIPALVEAIAAHFAGQSETAAAAGRPPQPDANGR